MAEKPLLLIDVDGPLNPWQQSNTQLRKGKKYAMHKLEGYQVWLCRRHGAELMKLADLYELVWCTTWEHKANTLIGPRIGLPELPVIEFAKYLPDKPPEPGLHWKTEPIIRYTDGRPFVWVDDEVTPADASYFKRNCAQKFSILRISPSLGLGDGDFADLAEWHKEWTRWGKALEYISRMEEDGE